MPFEPMARAREEELAGTRRLFGVRPLLTVLDGAPLAGSVSAGGIGTPGVVFSNSASLSSIV